MSPAAQIAVVGSVNVDISLGVAALPRPGDTVLATGRSTAPGGKGANQAVAAARLGSRVALLGAVGDDEGAATALRSLREAGVDLREVETADAPTGTAVVVVGVDGENLIVVDPGANALLSETHVHQSPAVAAANLVLLQLEVPLRTVEAAAGAASGTVVLNPAPARLLPEHLLRRVDVLVPNRGELAQLTGESLPRDVSEAASLARSISHGGTVVVTLGRHGALVIPADGCSTHVPGRPVKAVDTTGAGDAFCGALADALVRGADVREAAEWATVCAALSVGHRGAQSGMPTRAAAVRARNSS